MGVIGILIVKGDNLMRYFLILLTLIFLSGCADSVSYTEASLMAQVGFWRGLWHGMILPFSWFISLFSDSTAIYAIYNNGGWYDFGFILGCGVFTSSSTSATRR